jgi:hypothetical protein
VAHTDLDQSQGGARVGVVKDYIGDEETGIVIIEDEAGREGFDPRELVPVRRTSFGGPVILHPRHLRAALSTRQGLLALIMALVFALGLVTLSVRQHLARGTAALIGAAVLVAGCVLLYGLLKGLSDRRQA